MVYHTHANTISRTSTQKHGGDPLEGYEAGMDCEAWAVDVGISL